MIKSFLRWLFSTGDHHNDTHEILKKNPAFKSVNEMSGLETSTNNINGFVLEKGKIETIYTPDLGLEKDFRLAEWCVKTGQVVEPGKVVCLLENEDVTVEFESCYKGRMIPICALHQKLEVGDEIFKIEGV